jgi:hypothetical protein
MGFDAGQAGEPSLGAEAFAGKVRRQLSDHGALATLPVGEAFHLIRDL